jgi:hypothetical protein
MSATNFDELVILVAEEAPHALVLDWYRRLEQTMRDYQALRGITFSNGRSAERVIAADAQLGPVVAASIAELRATRNRLAHEWEPFAPADAEAFARRAFALMGQIMRPQVAPAT